MICFYNHYNFQYAKVYVWNHHPNEKCFHQIGRYFTVVQRRDVNSECCLQTARFFCWLTFTFFFAFDLWEVVHVTSK